jgi:hypothetical protein
MDTRANTKRMKGNGTEDNDVHLQALPTIRVYTTGICSRTFTYKREKTRMKRQRFPELRRDMLGGKGEPCPLPSSLLHRRKQSKLLHLEETRRWNEASSAREGVWRIMFGERTPEDVIGNNRELARLLQLLRGTINEYPSLTTETLETYWKRSDSTHDVSIRIIAWIECIEEEEGEWRRWMHSSSFVARDRLVQLFLVFFEIAQPLPDIYTLPLRRIRLEFESLTSRATVEALFHSVRHQYMEARDSKKEKEKILYSLTLSTKSEVSPSSLLMERMHDEQPDSNGTNLTYRVYDIGSEYTGWPPSLHTYRDSLFYRWSWKDCLDPKVNRIQARLVGEIRLMILLLSDSERTRLDDEMKETKDVHPVIRIQAWHRWLMLFLFSLRLDCSASLNLQSESVCWTGDLAEKRQEWFPIPLLEETMSHMEIAALMRGVRRQLWSLSSTLLHMDPILALETNKIFVNE